MRKLAIILVFLSFSFLISSCASLKTIAGIVVTGYSIYEATKE